MATSACIRGCHRAGTPEAYSRQITAGISKTFLARISSNSASIRTAISGSINRFIIPSNSPSSKARTTSDIWSSYFLIKYLALSLITLIMLVYIGNGPTGTRFVRKRYGATQPEHHNTQCPHVGWRTARKPVGHELEGQIPRGATGWLW